MLLRNRKKRKSNPTVQLTALVDAFTILVVFFIMQFSMQPENIKPEDALDLPVAQNAYATEFKDNVNVVINDKVIKINGLEMVNLSSGELMSQNLHKEDSEFIAGLHGMIEENPELVESKEHQWVILADKTVPYETVKKTIYTLAVSGFTKIKLASTVEFE